MFALALPVVGVAFLFAAVVVVDMGLRPFVHSVSNAVGAVPAAFVVVSGIVFFPVVLAAHMVVSAVLGGNEPAAAH